MLACGVKTMSLRHADQVFVREASVLKKDTIAAEIPRLRRYARALVGQEAEADDLEYGANNGYDGLKNNASAARIVFCSLAQWSTSTIDSTQASNASGERAASAYVTIR